MTGGKGRGTFATFVVFVTLLAACGDAGAPATATTATTMHPSSISTNSTTSTTSTTILPTTTLPPTTTTTAPPITVRDLRVGDTGPDVWVLEGALQDLGYWTGVVDDTFDSNTVHAVVALHKAAGLPREGSVNEGTRIAIAGATRPLPWSSEGWVAEVHLAEQLLLFVRDGKVETVLDTSTGKRRGTTPQGHWSLTRQINGYRRSRLGLLYRPKYFVGGVAVHGFPSVPSYPASHGCVRVTYPAMDHIWQADLLPKGTPVWVI